MQWSRPVARTSRAFMKPARFYGGGAPLPSRQYNPSPPVRPPLWRFPNRRTTVLLLQVYELEGELESCPLPARPAPFVSRPVQRTLLTPRVNPGSRYHRGRGHLRAARGPCQEESEPNIRPKTTLPSQTTILEAIRLRLSAVQESDAPVFLLLQVAAVLGGSFSSPLLQVSWD